GEHREGPAGRSLPGCDCNDAVGADEGLCDGGGVGAIVPRRADAEVDGEADARPDPETDLSGQLLPAQGGAREADVRADHDALWRPGPVEDGGIAGAARRGSQDGAPRADPRAQQP